MKKVLKSKKSVEIRELTALDDVLSYHLMGKSFDTENVLPSAMTHRYVSVVLSLVKVDEEDVQPPRSLEDAYQTLAQFSKKEWSEVLDLFDEVNGEDLGE
jgi:hypothetical protein